MVVVQNIISSLFNSHLFDFTQGWIYVFGVGVAGGLIFAAGPGPRVAQIAKGRYESADTPSARVQHRLMI